MSHQVVANALVLESRRPFDEGRLPKRTRVMRSSVQIVAHATRLLTEVGSPEATREMGRDGDALVGHFGVRVRATEWLAGVTGLMSDPTGALSTFTHVALIVVRALGQDRADRRQSRRTV